MITVIHKIRVMSSLRLQIKCKLSKKILFFLKDYFNSYNIMLTNFRAITIK